MGKRKGTVSIDTNDIVGKQLGRLTVQEYNGNFYDATKGGAKMRHYYKCECVCGVHKIIQRGPLLNEKVHSCGCLRREK